MHGRSAPSARAIRAIYGWGIKLLVALTAATYVLAGIAKLRLAGMTWLDGEQLRNQIAVDNARKVLFGATPSGIARAVARASELVHRVLDRDARDRARRAARVRPSPGRACVGDHGLGRFTSACWRG